MPYYVYILQSEIDNSYYKGFTENPANRIIQHNNAEMNYTAKKIPWKMVCLIIFKNKRDALIAEKRIKKYDKARLVVLIKSEKNILITNYPTVG